MKFLIYCYTVCVAILSCYANKPSKGLAIEPVVPVCIQQKIDSIKQQAVWNPPAEINEYDYADQTVYVISSPCCDFYSIAVDSNCNYVCAPSGGFTGKGDRKCVDFLEKAKHVQLVWKDDREK